MLPCILGYAGPILATFTLNTMAAVLAAVCVFLYLNREDLRKRRLLYRITKPLHAMISRIAQNKLKEAEERRARDRN